VQGDREFPISGRSDIAVEFVGGKGGTDRICRALAPLLELESGFFLGR
jgi:hypothetical protein